MAKEQKIIDRHLLTKVLKFCHTWETKANLAEMSNVKIVLTNIANKVPCTYNTNEGWVFEKIKPEYVNRITTIIPIIS